MDAARVTTIDTALEKFAEAVRQNDIPGQCTQESVILAEVKSAERFGARP
jgi:hypothetical protein